MKELVMKLDLLNLSLNTLGAFVPNQHQVVKVDENVVDKNILKNYNDLVEKYRKHDTLKITIATKDKQYLANEIKNKFQGDYEIYVSKFTDFVFLTLNKGWQEKILENLSLILKIKNFYSLNIFPISEEKVEFSRNIPSKEIFIGLDNEYLQRKRAYDYVGLTEEKRREFSTGEQNVKLGIYDDGKISPNPLLFDKEWITNKERFWWFNNTFGEHATNVASVAGGYKGVNERIKLYGIKRFNWNGISQEIEWLMSNGVKVINMSFGLGPGNKYNEYANYLDQLQNNKNNEVTIVTSAGNDAIYKEKDHNLQQNKLSYNSIVVGALDHNDFSKVASYSNYGSFSGGKSVTLSTPVPILSGTSFSSPLVAGVIASLMNKKEQIYKKGLDNLISLSALSSSSTQQDGIDEKMGAGVLNIPNLEKSLDNLKYIEFKGSDDHLMSQDKIVTHSVYLKKGQKLKAALAWNFKNEFEQDSHWYNLWIPTNNIEKPIVHDFDLYIESEVDQNIRSSSTSSNKNIEVASLYATKDGWYDIKVKQYKKMSRNQSYDLAISYSIQ
ncbi:SUBTILISIN: SERINE PROTEASE [Mycoplasmopsis pulmonis]|uniref:SUBTILISIN: SERINE PROTEASE n=2 Tax=Mycoplasmopsis pulmonis TaxID=2107 RepID=Q98PR4_MYCPU|nr:SUBTILISIN: SERINE PROTEASE [Mycoplasmopsis pulmonis]